MDAEVIVIGAGLSGLACALRLQQAGVRPLLLEAADRPGGRIATDARDGFLLDRGFQVLQTWYPGARRLLDYKTLDLRAFYPGALVRAGEGFHRVSDVWRHPERLPEMLLSPVGTFGDKLRLLKLRRLALAGELSDLYRRPETSALRFLQQSGFSEQIIERFFKPFFAGVFFEPDLSVSSRAFEFVFRAFARGDTSLPARGMAAIPLQLASRLPAEQIRLGCRVDGIADGQVVLDSGERLGARAIVVATDGDAAARLIGVEPRPVRGTTCFYFAAPQPPFSGPYLVLNGSGRGPVNSLLCPSNLSGAYAPPGESLVSVNIFGANNNPDAAETAIRKQLTAWYGSIVQRWRLLAVYRLPRALPSQLPPVTVPSEPLQLQPWLWVCGEHAAPPSIHWALTCGSATGEAVAASLGRKSLSKSADAR